MNGLPPTILDIKNQFNQAVLSQNTNANPTVKGTDWDVYGTSIAAVAALIRQDVQNSTNSIFTQFEKGIYLDFKAYSLGQLPRRAETFATLSASTSTSVTIPQNVSFTTTYNGVSYLVIQTITTTSPTTLVSLRSSQSGSGYSLPVGAVLTSSGYPNLTVTASTDGQAIETDGQLRQRLLFAEQNPTGGDRPGQYVSWALQSDPDVTGAIIEPELYPDTLTIGVFIFAGGENYYYLLTNVIPYNRTATTATIFNSAVYLNSVISLGEAVEVASISLYVPTNFSQTVNLTFSITLIEGLTLASIVTNIDGSPITVSALFQQELRRAFITYEFGGSEIDGDYFILTSRLIQGLWSSLSVRDGIYLNILVDIKANLNGVESANISIPHNYLDAMGNLVALYDFLTYDSAGTVVEVPGYNINFVQV